MTAGLICTITYVITDYDYAYCGLIRMEPDIIKCKQAFILASCDREILAMNMEEKGFEAVSSNRQKSKASFISPSLSSKSKSPSLANLLTSQKFKELVQQNRNASKVDVLPVENKSSTTTTTGSKDTTTTTEQEKSTALLLDELKNPLTYNEEHTSDDDDDM